MKIQYSPEKIREGHIRALLHARDVIEHNIVSMSPWDDGVEWTDRKSVQRWARRNCDHRLAKAWHDVEDAIRASEGRETLWWNYADETSAATKGGEAHEEEGQGQEVLT